MIREKKHANVDTLLKEALLKSLDRKETQTTSLSKIQSKLLEAAIKIHQDSSDEIGFVCRSMVSASMPHSKIKGLYYKRESNKFKLVITGNEDAGGVPYGTYPRLILSWLSGEIVKRKSREIVLGESLSDFMKKLGLLVSGGRWGTVSRFKEQLKKLFSSIITCTYEDNKKGEWLTTNMTIADKAQIFWNPSNSESLDLFNSKILIGEYFYEEVLKCPIPVDLRAINFLKDSSVALDLYFWLTYRMSYLSNSTLLSFTKLQEQFGAGYEDTPHGRYEFKRKFLHQLKKVLVIYPEAKIYLKENGLLLSPSPTHIRIGKV
jgi:hypothetical protein